MSSTPSETRTRILEATIELLEEHRGRGVRMADIARQAELSRQAVYLHFASRAELLEATTKYLDQKLDLNQRLARSRAATSGVTRLTAYIDCWGNYIPEIYAVAKAFLLVQETDEAAALAWNERMSAMRDGCRAAVDALHAEGNLASEWTRDSATDVLWAMLSIANWESLTIDCGWSTQQYVRRMKTMAKRILLSH